MAVPVKENSWIYHLTTINNLESILEHGLQPRNKLKDFCDIANPEIIDKRKELGLDEYVPFHFFSKNPFDGNVIKLNPDIKFIYIVLTREKAKNNNFKIIPIHPISLDEVKIYDYEEGFNCMDWETIEKRDYNDDDCKKKCMAECLWKGYITREHFHAIITPNNEIKGKVEEFVSKLTDKKNFFIDCTEGMFPTK